MPDAAPRVGLGFDVHRWGTDRTLRLGGVVFDGEPALDAHSDGDVVCHAIADAVLGAAAMGDLGQHYPDRDPSTEGIAGPTILESVRGAIAGAGWSVVSCDATVICERPAIAPRRDEMRAAIAAALGCSPDSVSVKATRPEGLGLAGDGVGCMAVAVLG